MKSETSWGTATWSEYASRDAGAYHIVEPGNPSKQTKSPGETSRVRVPLGWGGWVRVPWG